MPASPHLVLRKESSLSMSSVLCAFTEIMAVRVEFLSFLDVYLTSDASICIVLDASPMSCSMYMESNFPMRR